MQSKQTHSTTNYCTIYLRVLYLLPLFTLFQKSSSLSMQSSSNTVKLSFRENSIHDTTESPPPPTLFLHGLDSSSHTWRNNLDKLGSKAVALDLRGCGNSPLGDPKDFSPDGIVNDIHAFLCSHPYFCCRDKVDDTAINADAGADDHSANIIPFVMTGHSMGGRIAMSFAARYPELIKALVIEDMDVRTRPMEMNIFQSQNRDATVNFNRCMGGTDENQLIDCFEREGYPGDSVRKWLKEGRLELKDDGSYYSQVNPAFRILCYEQFFVTSHGEDTWMELVEQSKYRFPVHVMVADKEKTVCDEESLWFMKDTMKKGEKFMVLHRYKGATHSIHNSAQKDFLKDLATIIRTASLT
jgi:pimeloyl-ACP methyl ester carboxylesterase